MSVTSTPPSVMPLLQVWLMLQTTVVAELSTIMMEYVNSFSVGSDVYVVDVDMWLCFITQHPHVSDRYGQWGGVHYGVGALAS